MYNEPQNQDPLVIAMSVEEPEHRSLEIIQKWELEEPEHRCLEIIQKRELEEPQPRCLTATRCQIIDVLQHDPQLHRQGHERI